MGTLLSSRRLYDAALWLACLAAMTLVYWPALRGGLLWDDDAHITLPELRSLGGLFRIWLEIGATQQYYPLLHTAFWLQWWCWGEETTGYHLVTLALHAANAVLVFRVVRESFRGHASRQNIESISHLAAGLWAFHPVMVESVAWITELKNTLSTFFYLISLWAFLRAVDPAAAGSPFLNWRRYILSLVVFVLALMTKTVTATLPGAILVILWWREGRLTWQQIRPTLPMWILGAAAGLLTASVERQYIGAQGAEFDWGWIERLLIAGRVIWFYLAKLALPVNLMFIYPRWDINAGDFWQWRWLIGTLGVICIVWFARPFGTAAKRGVVAVALLFVGSLLPVLGFFNVYPFLYSFVADHFQYLASIAVMAGVAVPLSRVRFSWVIIPALAAMSWSQSRDYSNSDALYMKTIERNPKCWMAHNNYGGMLLDQNRFAEAEIHINRGLEINPRNVPGWITLGGLYYKQKRYQEAHDAFQKGLELRPDDWECLFNLGRMMIDLGRVEEAVAWMEKAWKANPADPRVLRNLGVAYRNLGSVLLSGNQDQQALEALDAAKKLLPDDAGVRLHRGQALIYLKRPAEALDELQYGADISPNDARIQNELAGAFFMLKQYEKAIRHLNRALEIEPGNAMYADNLRKMMKLAGQGDGSK